MIQIEPGIDLRFRGWERNPDLEGAFAIDPPEGFEKAETLFPSEGEMGEMMGDAPMCDKCGHITVRNGSCYRCYNCGNSMGCS